MYLKSGEEVYIRNVENGIRGLKLGTKTPETCNVGPSLNRLKTVNEPMYLELMERYKKAVKDWHEKNPDK